MQLGDARKLSQDTQEALIRSKPLRRSYQQQPERIKRWLKEEYPAIAKRAKAEDAEIQWGDKLEYVRVVR